MGGRRNPLTLTPSTPCAHDVQRLVTPLPTSPPCSARCGPERRRARIHSRALVSARCACLATPLQPGAYFRVWPPGYWHCRSVTAPNWRRRAERRPWTWPRAHASASQAQPPAFALICCAASQPLAKKVASARALFAPLGTTLAHSARVRTIKHRLERWLPLECPRRAAPTAAKECSGERTTKPVTQKKRSARLRAVSKSCTPPLCMRPSFRVS